VADDVIKLEGEARLDDVTRGLEKVEAALDLIQGKGTQELLIEAEVQAALQEVERLKKAVDEVGTDEEKVRIEADTGPAIKKLEELSQTYRKRLEEMRRQDSPFDALGRDAREEVTKAIRRLRELEEGFRQATNRMRRAAEDVDFDPASDSAKRLQRDVATAARAMIRHLDGLDPEIRQKVTGFNDVAEAARKASAEVRRFEASKLDDATASVGRLSGAFKTLQIAANAFFASIIVDKVVRFGREVVEAAASLQDMERAYTALFKTQEEGNRQMERAEELATLLGLSLETTRQGFLNFVVSAREAGFEAETAAALYESLAISAKGMGGTQEEANNALRAFSQIISKGKIQAEELRGQLGDALPGALSILAKELGKTTQELDAMLEKGELTTDELIALSNGMLKVFGPAAVANIEGTTAEMDRFRTALGRASEIIGGELSKQVALFLQDLHLMGDEGETQAERVGEAIGDMAETVRRAITVITDILKGDLGSAWRQAGAAVVGFAGTVVDVLANLAGVLAEIAALPIEGIRRAIAAALEETFGAVQEFLDAAGEALPGRLGEAARQAAENLGVLERKFAEVGDSAKGMSERFGSDVRAAVGGVAGALKEVADELEEMARTSRGTTDEQIGHQEELQRKVDELWKLFERLINERVEGASKVTEAERKELAKQEKLFEDFAAKVRGILAGVGEVEVKPVAGRGDQGGGGGGDSRAASELQANLASLREELARLQAQPVLSVEELNRISELNSLIYDAERGLVSLGQAANEALGNFGRDPNVGNFGSDITEQFEEVATGVEDRGAQMVDALTALIGSDTFQDAFSGLDSAAQSRIKSIVGQFLEIQDTVGATEEDIRVFTEAILSELGGRAASALSAFGDQFGDALEPSAIDRAWEALRNLGDGAEEAGGKAEELGGKLDGVGVKMEEVGGEIHVFTEGLEEGGKQIEGAGDSAEEAADGIGKAGDAAEETGEKLEGAGDAAEGAGEKIKQGAEILGPVADRLMGVGDSAEDAGEGLEGAGDAAEDAGGKMEQAGEGAQSLQEHIEAMGGDVVEAGIKIEGTGEKIEILKDGVEQTGEAAEEAGIKIEGTGEKIEITGQKAEESAEKVTAAGEAVGEAAEPMEQLGEAAEKTAEPLGDVAEAADKIAGSTGAPETLRAIAEASEEAAEPAQRAGEAAKLLADALEKMGQSEAATTLRELVAGLQEVVEPLGTATEAAAPFADLMAGLAESIGIAADNLDRTVAGLSSFAEKISEVADLLEQGRLQEGIALLAEAMAEATPAIQAAAEQLDKSAQALSTIAEQSIASADGIRLFADASTEAVESGALEELAKVLEDLGEKVAPVAKDFVDIATAIERIVESAPEVVEAAEIIGEALDELATEERIEAIQELLSKLQEIRDALSAAEKNATQLIERFDELKASAEEVQAAMSSLATVLQGEVASALQEIVGYVEQLVGKLKETVTESGLAVEALLELEAVIPIIEAVTMAVAALAAQISAAASAAAELKDNLSEVSI
jgi:tape measure domain-containing protein